MDPDTTSNFDGSGSWNLAEKLNKIYLFFHYFSWDWTNKIFLKFYFYLLTCLNFWINYTSDPHSIWIRHDLESKNQLKNLYKRNPVVSIPLLCGEFPSLRSPLHVRGKSVLKLPPPPPPPPLATVQLLNFSFCFFLPLYIVRFKTAYSHKPAVFTAGYCQFFFVRVQMICVYPEFKWQRIYYILVLRIRIRSGIRNDKKGSSIVTQKTYAIPTKNCY